MLREIAPSATLSQVDTEKIEMLEAQVDKLEEDLRREEAEHKETKDQLENLQVKLKVKQLHMIRF